MKCFCAWDETPRASRVPTAAATARQSLPWASNPARNAASSASVQRRGAARPVAPASFRRRRPDSVTSPGTSSGLGAFGGRGARGFFSARGFRSLGALVWRAEGARGLRAR